MPNDPFRRDAAAARPLRLVLAALMLLLARPGPASAHDFTVALRTQPAEGAALASAVRAMRLAAAERDGHADETADGHLGGLDLFIRPEPESAARGIDGLRGAPPGPADILVVLGADSVRPGSDGPVRIAPGTLPPAWQDASDPARFAARFRAAYGTPPDRAAALAYNAARRIDLALRAQGGVGDRAALVRAFRATAPGIEW